MTVSNEDKVKEALNIIETASVKLEAHGFIDYDCDYLIFALNKFRSPTWGPSILSILKKYPAFISKHFASLGFTIISSIFSPFNFN